VVNALLKLIEEPPTYLYISVTAETDHFLPTLRSRLQIIDLQEADSASSTTRANWAKVMQDFNLENPKEREAVRRLLFWYPMVHQTINSDAVLDPFKQLPRA